MILGSIDEGDQSGAKLAPACDALGITSRTIARCVREEIGQMAGLFSGEALVGLKVKELANLLQDFGFFGHGSW